MNPISIALLVMKLAPELRALVVALVQAFHSGDELGARRAYEAARRLAFKAKQKP